MAPLRHVLLGMNAHINYDLPQALLAVISDAEFGDTALLARREADHRHIDQVLATLAGASEGLTETGGRPRGTTARLADRANLAATRRFLAEARAEVWANAGILARARRDGRDRSPGAARRTRAASRLAGRRSHPAGAGADPARGARIRDHPPPRPEPGTAQPS